MRVGFIGLGQLGRPIAHNLLRHGTELTVSSGSDRWFTEFRVAGAVATMDSADFATADMPVLAAASTTYQNALLQGHGASDKGAMIRVFEDLLGVTYSSRRSSEGDAHRAE